MGIVPVSFRADVELAALKGFADLLPHFDDDLVRATTPRHIAFADGALEYVSFRGLFAVFSQSMVDGEDALVSTVSIVDAAGLHAMTKGESLRPDVSLSSYSGTSYPGIVAILGTLGEAVTARIAEHEADPALNADFDWCASIERRASARRTRAVRTAAEMTPALAEVKASRRAA